MPVGFCAKFEWQAQIGWLGGGHTIFPIGRVLVLVKD